MYLYSAEWQVAMAHVTPQQPTRYELRRDNGGVQATGFRIPDGTIPALRRLARELLTEDGLGGDDLEEGVERVREALDQP